MRIIRIVILSLALLASAAGPPAAVAPLAAEGPGSDCVALDCPPPHPNLRL